MADSTIITVPANTGVRIEVEGVSTDFHNLAGVVIGGAEDRTLPTTPDATAELGPLPEGTELQFYLRPDGAPEHLTGPDRIHVEQDGPDAATLSFEDYQDSDFNDLVLGVTFLTEDDGAGGDDGGSEASSPAAPPSAEAVDWDALAAQVMANLGATGRWSAGEESTWPTHSVDGTDWNALAAQVTANHAATGHWIA